MQRRLQVCCWHLGTRVALIISQHVSTAIIQYCKGCMRVRGLAGFHSDANGEPAPSEVAAFAQPPGHGLEPPHHDHPRVHSVDGALQERSQQPVSRCKCASYPAPPPGAAFGRLRILLFHLWPAVHGQQQGQHHHQGCLCKRQGGAADGSGWNSPCKEGCTGGRRFDEQAAAAVRMTHAA